MPRTDTASRLIPASPEQIWAALVDADALIQWLPPTGMTGRFEHFDPRPGGSFRMILTLAANAPGHGKTTESEDVVAGRIVELVPNVRLVQTGDFDSDDPAFAGTMTMTWTLTAAEGGTVVEIRADNVPDGISAEDHAEGFNSSLTNLALYLASS